MSDNKSPKVKLQIMVKLESYHYYKEELKYYKDDGKNAASLFSDMLKAYHEKQYPGEVEELGEL